MSEKCGLCPGLKLSQSTVLQSKEGATGQPFNSKAKKISSIYSYHLTQNTNSIAVTKNSQMNKYLYNNLMTYKFTYEKYSTLLFLKNRKHAAFW